MSDIEFTTDTRKAHCPIRIVYSSAGVGPYHTNELHDRPAYAGLPISNVVALAIIKGTEHGDYGGSSVEHSNYHAMLEHEDIRPHVIEIYGSHGYRALAYDATLGPVPACWDIANALDGFENHCPVFDDDHHGGVEAELESVAWEADGRDDFRKALTGLLDALDEDHEHDIPSNGTMHVGLAQDLANMSRWQFSDPAATWDDFLTRLWHRGCDALNVNGGSGHVIETGCNVHFYIDEWCAKGGKDARYRYPDDKPIQALLRKLARATRVY
jgi:hypothetical protein